MVTDFAKKQRLKRLIYSPLSIIVIVLFSLMLLKGSIGMYGKYVEAKQQRDFVESELNNLKNRKDFLESELKALSSNAGFEERLRKNFDVKREGEHVSVIVRASDSGEKGVDTEVKPSESWLSKFVVKIVDFLQ